MRLNIEKLKAVSKPRDPEKEASVKWHRQNRCWLTLSQDISLCIHYYLQQKNISRSQFASRLGVSVAYVSKLLKGREKLNLETIAKIQNALGEQIIQVRKPYINTAYMLKDGDIIFTCESKSKVCKETISYNNKEFFEPWTSKYSIDTLI